MEVGKTLRNLSFAALAVSSCAALDQVRPSTPAPIETQDLRSEEERNTDIAREFLGAIFSNDIDRILSFLPETRSAWDRASSKDKDSFRQSIKIFSTCDPNTLKKIRYDKQQFFDSASSKNYDIIDVVFELDPRCKAIKDGKEIIGWTVYVELRQTQDGETRINGFSTNSFGTPGNYK